MDDLGIEKPGEPPRGNQSPVIFAVKTWPKAK
jgi:hypothetical protein